MEQQHARAWDAHSPEAATDEPAFPSTPPASDDEAAAPATDYSEQVFATRDEEDAYWAGVAHGLRVMNGDHHAEPGSPERPASGAPGPASFEPSGRRVRHDGWTPEKKARCLEVLAACGVVADACRAAGMSVQSAYALRNRRDGRAFAMAWDAILIHRARARLSGEVLSRAINGCVETLHRDGVVVAERHRHDNRLAMSVLTRLDRLAETRESEEAETLRAVSEDFEELLQCIETGGDADAFIEARRPAPPESAGPEEEEPLDYTPDDLDALAEFCGLDNWRDVDFTEIPVDDLDPDLKSEWSMDGWIRADRSYYLAWLAMAEESGCLPDGPDCPAAFEKARRGVLAKMEADEADEAEGATEAEAEAQEPAARLGRDVSQPSTSPDEPGSSAAAAPADASSERSRGGPDGEAADVSRARPTARLGRDVSQPSTSSTSPVAPATGEPDREEPDGEAGAAPEPEDGG